MWAGLLVALALTVYSNRRWAFSVGLALCAVLIRELALPLPLIMMAFAARERPFTDAAAWLGVVAAFGVAMAVHLQLAGQQLLASDPANSWTAIGGWGFVLSTARWNIFLLQAPAWLNALLVPCAMFGLVGWSNRASARALILAAAWLTAFLFLGRPDNHYWGLMYAPLLALGIAFVAPSCFALLKAAALLPELRPRARQGLQQ